jgi:hypothetical protein
MIGTIVQILQADMIPTELVPRNEPMTVLVGALLFLCFMMISFSRFFRPNAFRNLLIANTKIQGLRTFVNEVFPLNKRSSILLLLNYQIAFGLMLMLGMNSGWEIGFNKWFIVIGVPILFLLWTLGGLFFARIITGEKEVFTEAFIMKIIGTELLGAVLFIGGLIWSLNAFYEPFLVKIIITLLISGFAFRSIKSMIAVYMKGVSWYYIILYFCTLEILPLFVAYYLLSENFNV